MNCNTTSRSRSRNLNGLIAPTLNTLFNEIMQGPINTVEKPNNRPAVNIDKTKEAYILNFALPGVNKEDIDIKVENNKLTISSKTDSDDKSYRLREFNYSNFSRTFKLPKNIVTSEITADYKDGILETTLPIAPETQPKSITIK